MPYWSSSRVGADPVNGKSSAPKWNKRSFRQGITMEDLKKQTALRLAQEQGRGESTQAGGGGGGVVETAAPRGLTSPPSKAHHVHGSPYHQNLGTPTTTTPDHSFQTSQHGNSTHPSAGAQDTYRMEELVLTPGKHPSHSYQSPTEIHRQQRAPTESHRQQRGSEHHRAPPSQTISASLSVDSATEKGANAKLPHGLTVHELKEMTKARLEAEAVQKGDVNPVELLHGSIPSTVRVSSEYRDQTGGRTAAASPVSPRVYGRLAARSPYPADTTAEAWENASVSTSASDYPGSESVYSSGVNGTSSFNGEEALPFSRSASYPNNTHMSGIVNDWSHENPPPPYIASPVAYYDGYVPNRRRAATLSPRPGLSHVHEDRPGPVLPMPSIPSEFSGPSLQRQRLPTRSRSAFVPEALNYGQPQGAYPHCSAGVIGNNESNRPRTLSAASLPATSHTAEEFSLDNRGTTARFSSQFGSVREDAAVTGLSDVFRGSPICFGESTALIGFGSTNSSMIGLASSMDSFGGDPMRMRAATSSDFGGGLNDSFGMTSGSQDDLRHRASTWGEPSSLDMFCGHDLSEDLASILKLSGAEQKDDSS